MSDLRDTLYKDNGAPAAAGLVCVLLEKTVKRPLSIQKETANELDRTMNNNTQEIRDDEINVEEIMAHIQKNMRRRQEAGESSPDPDSCNDPTFAKVSPDTMDESFRRELNCINSTWDIHNNNYFISSHRPYLGNLLVKGRQVVHGEVRRYTDPMISRQTEFNASMVHILNQTSQKFAELDLQISQQDEKFVQKYIQQEMALTQKISQQEQELTQKISQQEQELTQKISQQEQELTQKISQQEQELTQKISQQEQEFNLNIQNHVNSNFRETFSQIDKDLRLKMGLIHILEDRIQKEPAQNRTDSESESFFSADTNYFLFEERFRGSREEIKQRQLSFLPYFRNCSHVLDIGCGRGEFLEILRNNNIEGFGVDLDADMVAYCKSRQLEVEQGDAIAYLENLGDKSLDGIFIDQVVEHLEPAYLVRLLALCHQKLKFGYYIVVETVNPLSFVSFVNFYIDLTHKRPVHPETLQFLMSVAGFRNSEKKFSSPVSDESRLKKISEISGMDAAFQMNVDIYNQNIELLNTILFGPQDYAVIGKK